MKTYSHIHPSLHTCDFVVCAQNVWHYVVMSFFLKSVLMAPFVCGPTAFLKQLSSLNEGLCLRHVTNIPVA
jgi:hypothetical protein